jgi:dihydroorotase-like cyclic amidohydrolase
MDCKSIEKHLFEIMKKLIKHTLLLLSILSFSCEDEMVTPKSDLQKLTEEINSIIAVDTIKKVEVYKDANIVLKDSKYDFEIRNQYLYRDHTSGTYYFDLTKLIFYQIRSSDSTLVIAF